MGDPVQPTENERAELAAYNDKKRTWLQVGGLGIGALAGGFLLPALGMGTGMGALAGGGLGWLLSRVLGDSGIFDGIMSMLLGAPPTPKGAPVSTGPGTQPGVTPGGPGIGGPGIGGPDGGVKFTSPGAGGPAGGPAGTGAGGNPGGGNETGEGRGWKDLSLTDVTNGGGFMSLLGGALAVAPALALAKSAPVRQGIVKPLEALFSRRPYMVVPELGRGIWNNVARVGNHVLPSTRNLPYLNEGWRPYHDRSGNLVYRAFSDAWKPLKNFWNNTKPGAGWGSRLAAPFVAVADVATGVYRTGSINEPVGVAVNHVPAALLPQVRPVIEQVGATREGRAVLAEAVRYNVMAPAAAEIAADSARTAQGAIETFQRHITVEQTIRSMTPGRWGRWMGRTAPAPEIRTQLLDTLRWMQGGPKAANPSTETHRAAARHAMENPAGLRQLATDLGTGPKPPEFASESLVKNYVDSVIKNAGANASPTTNQCVRDGLCWGSGATKPAPGGVPPTPEQQAAAERVLKNPEALKRVLDRVEARGKALPNGVRDLLLDANKGVVTQELAVEAQRGKFLGPEPRQGWFSNSNERTAWEGKRVAWNTAEKQLRAANNGVADPVALENHSLVKAAAGMTTTPEGIAALEAITEATAGIKNPAHRAAAIEHVIDTWKNTTEAKSLTPRQLGGVAHQYGTMLETGTPVDGTTVKTLVDAEAARPARARAAWDTTKAVANKAAQPFKWVAGKASEYVGDVRARGKVAAAAGPGATSSLMGVGTLWQVLFGPKPKANPALAVAPDPKPAIPNSTPEVAPEPKPPAATPDPKAVVPDPKGSALDPAAKPGGTPPEVVPPTGEQGKPGASATEKTGGTTPNQPSKGGAVAVLTAPFIVIGVDGTVRKVRAGDINGALKEGGLTTGLTAVAIADIMKMRGATGPAVTATSYVGGKVFPALLVVSSGSQLRDQYFKPSGEKDHLLIAEEGLGTAAGVIMLTPGTGWVGPIAGTAYGGYKAGDYIGERLGIFETNRSASRSIVVDSHISAAYTERHDKQNTARVKPGQRGPAEIKLMPFQLPVTTEYPNLHDALLDARNNGLLDCPIEGFSALPAAKISETLDKIYDKRQAELDAKRAEIEKKLGSAALVKIDDLLKEETRGQGLNNLDNGEILKAALSPGGVLNFLTREDKAYNVQTLLEEYDRLQRHVKTVNRAYAEFGRKPRDEIFEHVSQPYTYQSRAGIDMEKLEVTNPLLHTLIEEVREIHGSQSAGDTPEVKQKRLVEAYERYRVMERQVLTVRAGQYQADKTKAKPVERWIQDDFNNAVAAGVPPDTLELLTLTPKNAAVYFDTHNPAFPNGQPLIDMTAPICGKYTVAGLQKETARLCEYGNLDRPALDTLLTQIADSSLDTPEIARAKLECFVQLCERHADKRLFQQNPLGQHPPVQQEVWYMPTPFGHAFERICFEKRQHGFGLRCNPAWKARLKSWQELELFGPEATNDSIIRLAELKRKAGLVLPKENGANDVGGSAGDHINNDKQLTAETLKKAQANFKAEGYELAGYCYDGSDPVTGAHKYQFALRADDKLPKGYELVLHATYDANLRCFKCSRTEIRPQGTAVPGIYMNTDSKLFSLSSTGGTRSVLRTAQDELKKHGLDKPDFTLVDVQQEREKDCTGLRAGADGKLVEVTNYTSRLNKMYVYDVSPEMRRDMRLPDNYEVVLHAHTFVDPLFKAGKMEYPKKQKNGYVDPSFATVTLTSSNQLLNPYHAVLNMKLGADGQYYVTQYALAQNGTGTLIDLPQPIPYRPDDAAYMKNLSTWLEKKAGVGDKVIADRIEFREKGTGVAGVYYDFERHGVKVPESERVLRPYELFDYKVLTTNLAWQASPYHHMAYTYAGDKMQDSGRKGADGKPVMEPVRVGGKRVVRLNSDDKRNYGRRVELLIERTQVNGREVDTVAGIAFVAPGEAPEFKPPMWPKAMRYAPPNYKGVEVELPVVYDPHSVAKLEELNKVIRQTAERDGVNSDRGVLKLKQIKDTTVADMKEIVFTRTVTVENPAPGKPATYTEEITAYGWLDPKTGVYRVDALRRRGPGGDGSVILKKEEEVRFKLYDPASYKALEDCFRAKATELGCEGDDIKPVSTDTRTGMAPREPIAVTREEEPRFAVADVEDADSAPPPLPVFNPPSGKKDSRPAV